MNYGLNMNLVVKETILLHQKKEEEIFIEWPELNQNKEIEVKYTKYDLCTIG